MLAPCSGMLIKALDIMSHRAAVYGSVKTSYRRKAVLITTNLQLRDSKQQPETEQALETGDEMTRRHRRFKKKPGFTVLGKDDSAK
jgi:hypothetical protein